MLVNTSVFTADTGFSTDSCHKGCIFCLPDSSQVLLVVMEQVKPVVCAGSVRLAEKCGVTRIRRLGGVGVLSVDLK